MTGWFRVPHWQCIITLCRRDFGTTSTCNMASKRSHWTASTPSGQKRVYHISLMVLKIFVYQCQRKSAVFFSQTNKRHFYCSGHHHVENLTLFLPCLLEASPVSGLTSFKTIDQRLQEQPVIYRPIPGWKRCWWFILTCICYLFRPSKASSQIQSRQNTW